MATGSKRLRGKSWELRVYAGNGRYVQETVKPVRGEPVKEKLVDGLLRKLIEKVERGELTGDQGTVAELWRRWWEQESSGWAPGTYDAWESYGRLHVLPELGALPVNRVTVETVDDFYKFKAKTLAPGSVQKMHTALRLAFSAAVRWGWIYASPVDKARPPRGERKEIDPPSSDTVTRFMALAEETNPEFCTVLHLAADTGARRSMIAGLRWHHIDLDAGNLIFATAAVHSRARGVVVRETTKTKNGNRVALHWTTVQRLREHRKRCEERAELFGVAWSERMYVFTTDPEGRQPRRPDGLTQAFGRLRERAGVQEEVRLHDLRHFMATTYLAAGVDRRTVMARGGWASMQSLNRYAHFEPATDRAAADRVGNSIFGSGDAAAPADQRADHDPGDDDQAAGGSRSGAAGKDQSTDEGGDDEACDGPHERALHRITPA